MTIRRLNQRKPWQRGAYNPAELDRRYIEKQKVEFARKNALRLLEGAITTWRGHGLMQYWTTLAYRVG